MIEGTTVRSTVERKDGEPVNAGCATWYVTSCANREKLKLRSYANPVPSLYVRPLLGFIGRCNDHPLWSRV